MIWYSPELNELLTLAVEQINFNLSESKVIFEYHSVLKSDDETAKYAWYFVGWL